MKSCSASQLRLTRRLVNMSGRILSGELSMGRRSTFACLTLVLFLFGCAEGPSGSDQQTSEPREPASIGGSAGGNEDDSNPGNSARLLKTGFGQSGEYAWVTSLVENQSEGNIGQFVTVQFSLLDSNGEILASTDQVESFSRADQKLAVGTQVEIPDRGKVAKVEATMEVSDHADVDAEPFPEITTGNVKVVKSEYGGTVGRVQVSNPTDKSLKSPRVGVICLDAKDRVIGGGSGYPELVPPSGKMLLEVTLIASGKIERCGAHARPGV
jgi:hypothetical protein